jgi:tetraacyldisaccharide 4'-kinase
MSLHVIFPKLWQMLPKHKVIMVLWIVLLSPFAWIYGLVVTCRKFYFYFKPSQKLKKREQKQDGYIGDYIDDYHVHVVGNMTSGGNNKTPMILCLAEQYLQQNRKIAIISRGYGRDKAVNKKINEQGKNSSNANLSNTNLYGLQINPEKIKQSLSNSCQLYGDEPVMLFHRLMQNYDVNHFQIWIGSNRQQLVQTILSNFPEVQEIISDDGLQHYPLYRDNNFIMYREEKNQWSLPIGPFREPRFLRYLNMNSNTKNHFINIEKEIRLMPLYWQKIQHPSDFSQEVPLLKIPLLSLNTNLNTHLKKIHVVAGIARPSRFYDTLEILNITKQQQIHYHLQDHQAFSDAWLNDFYKNINLNHEIVVMTEKDFVKCHDFLMKNPQYANISYYLVMNLEKIPM